MNKNYSFLFILLFLFCLQLPAVTITSTAAGGNWTATTTWVGGIVPVAANDVVIAATASVTMDGNPAACTNLTLNGTLNWSTASRTLNVGGNMTMNTLSTLSGSATGIINVAGTYTAAAGTETIGRVTIVVTGNSTINGIVTVSNTNGNKTFNGNFTLNNASGLLFTAAESMDISGAVITNGTVTSSGTATGILNVGTTLSVNAGSTFSVSDLTIAVTGATTIDGTIRYGNNGGNKTFGVITVSATGTWDCSATDEQFVLNGNLTNNGTFNGSQGTTSGTEYLMNQPGLIINGTLTIANLRVTGTGSAQNNGTLTITNLLNGSGAFIQGTSAVLNMQIPSTGGGFTVTAFDGTTNTPNLVDYNYSGAQTVRNTGYYNLNISSSGLKTLGGTTTTVNNNLLIQNTAQLDASASNYSLILKGNWMVTSTNSDPFVEQGGTVTFSGTSGTQQIFTPLAQETFYHLVISNTSAASPGVKTSKALYITNQYDQTAGMLDLNGKNLTVASGATVATVCNLSAGMIMSSAGGSAIDFSDGAANMLNVQFSGTNVGTAAMPIPLTITTGRCCLDHLELYGVGNFTKQYNIDDVCNGGGNIYHNAVTFTAEVTASRWRMGDTGAQPDVFYGNATFNANAKGGTNNNFIVGANTIGNQYYGTTTFLSTTIGGFYVGRSNGTGNSSHTFHGPVIITVNDSGNVVLGNTGVANLCTINLESTIQINSNTTSIGDVYIGNNNYTTVNMYNSAQIVDGTIQGATNIYFNNVTQTNSLTNTTTSTAASNSTIYIGTGSGSNGPCIFNGNVLFTSPNISLRGSTFNGVNTFQSNGTAGFSSYGGNVFNASTIFFNNGAGYWRLANAAGDDYNASATFRQAAGAGALDPAYNSTCTFSSAISTAGTGTSISFANGTAGRVQIDGNASQVITGSSSLPPSIKRLTMATSSGGTLTLNVPVTITAGGDLAMSSGIMFTTASNILKLADETVTSTIGNASSYVDGPMSYGMGLNGTATLNFPIGKAADWRPCVLTPTHSSNTVYAYTAQLFNASAYALGYTIPPTLDTVSFIHYWQIDRTIASSGAASQASFTGGIMQLYYGTTDGVYSASNLRMAKTVTTGTVWNDIGGTGTANFVGSIASTVNFNTSGTFTLAAANAAVWNPLPVELLDFKVARCDQQACLSWSTSSETNNDHFTIERSADGQTFEAIGMRQGAGTSTIRHNYGFTDPLPYNGISYYRLKQTDFNGAYSYSEVRTLMFDNSTISFHIYPNPNDGSVIHISLETATNKAIPITIHDITGCIIYSAMINVNDNANDYSITPGHTLSAGVYFVNAVVEGKVMNEKLIVR